METQSSKQLPQSKTFGNERQHHARALGFSVLLVLTGCLVGCSSTKPMALKGYKAGVASANPIGVFSLRTENAYKPGYQPEVLTVGVIPAGQTKTQTFEVGKPHSKGKDQFYEYLISVELPPGDHVLGPVTGGSSSFLVSGRFDFPINARFALPGSGINYLGHVTMTNRKRQEDEKRSGSVFPLIDQAATGFAGGTFDITIKDSSEEDLAAFKKAYPAIQNVEIGKAIMQK
jgi:hypothetical protein